MEIGRGEIAFGLQPRPIQNGHPPMHGADEPIAPQSLKCSVDVNRSQPSSVSDLSLRHRPLVLRPLAKAGCLLPHSKLAAQVRDTLARMTAPHIQDPLAKDRRVHQRVVPERPSNCRVIAHCLLQRLLRYVGDMDLGERLHTVIGDRQQLVLQIEPIAANMQRQDLARTITGNLVRVRKA